MWLHFHKIIESELSQRSPSPVIKLLTDVFYFWSKTGSRAIVKKDNVNPAIPGDLETYTIRLYEISAWIPITRMNGWTNHVIETFNLLRDGWQN